MSRPRISARSRSGDHDEWLGMSRSSRPDGWRTPTIEDPDHPVNRQKDSGDTLLSSGSSTGRRKDTELGAAPQSNMIQPVPLPPLTENEKPKTLPLKKRLKHVTWAWFTITMATGGIANALYSVPYRFPGLRVIGVIFFLLNIVLYIGIWAMMITRFYLYPYTFRASLTHPTESLFVPAFAVSFGTILINIVEYGFNRTGPWLNHAVVILYWFDAAIAFVLSIGIYLTLWSSQSFTISRMTPIWIFPAYPLLIIGPHAAYISAQLQDPRQAIQIIIGGFTVQGIGFLVSLTIYSAFVYRLMTQKLPAESLRPGMFVSVGPSAFTVSGVLGMATSLQDAIAKTPESTFMEVPGLLAAQILRLIASWMSLWLWGLAWWFFFVSLLSNADCLRAKHRTQFAMTWYSFIFPQTALTTATFSIANAFEVTAINIIGCVMVCLLIIVWFVVVGCMLKAIYKRQILWPEKGEDKTEGGFKARQEEGSLLPTMAPDQAEKEGGPGR
ncbi:uncharacterized protein A1O9_03936 [Exophiala aquamarina CBS 119918]|uniref:C4-dicarboxylate transporter/malic acid transporter n=1 Tax=Exophiala aquamarina CBS 119918 TaxID=1182545 RepID=A0A072PH58_9EURO|nr:uncharacterized protein A1O9_03936 [Exophiala aquamarina CBS 119918]KEF59092.1 hypothetical protein A1O9_03936 [Exophiala aquamarina CBS 119918]